MTRVFECERCRKIYKNNENKLMMKYAKFPSLVFTQSSNAGHIKFCSSDYEYESDYINLCDECMMELYNFLSNKEE